MIEIPPHILIAIEKILQTVSLQKLSSSAEILSENYRKQSYGRKQTFFMNTSTEKKAYLALRFPATFAAVSAVISQIEFPIKTVLDVGSGPGTATLAALNTFAKIEEVTLLEQDQELSSISKNLLNNYHVNKFFFNQTVQSFTFTKSYDLIVAAYSLSECPSTDLKELLERIWTSTAAALVIVESGTPYGFDLIHKAREQLISLGASILAPCTHENQCPLFQKKDWCHFAVRLNRPSFQRYVKSADLGYEDEKYSYLVVTKNKPLRHYARLVKTPEKHSGHVRLILCASNGLEEKIVSKRNKELYKLAKKVIWGDTWDA